MSSLSDLSNDFAKLKSARRKWQKRTLDCVVSNQNARRPSLGVDFSSGGLPATANFDWSKEAIAKVQDALAEAERDP